MLDQWQENLTALPTFNVNKSPNDAFQSAEVLPDRIETEVAVVCLGNKQNYQAN